MKTESRSEEESEWNGYAILGLTALLRVSLGLYGAALGICITLTHELAAHNRTEIPLAACSTHEKGSGVWPEPFDTRF